MKGRNSPDHRMREITNQSNAHHRRPDAGASRDNDYHTRPDKREREEQDRESPTKRYRPGGSNNHVRHGDEGRSYNSSSYRRTSQSGFSGGRSDVRHRNHRKPNEYRSDGSWRSSSSNSSYRGSTPSYRNNAGRYKSNNPHGYNPNNPLSSELVFLLKNRRSSLGSLLENYYRHFRLKEEHKNPGNIAKIALMHLCDERNKPSEEDIRKLLDIIADILSHRDITKIINMSTIVHRLGKLIKTRVKTPDFKSYIREDFSQHIVALTKKLAALSEATGTQVIAQNIANTLFGIASLLLTLYFHDSEEKGVRAALEVALSKLMSINNESKLESYKSQRNFVNAVSRLVNGKTILPMQGITSGSTIQSSYSHRLYSATIKDAFKDNKDYSVYDEVDCCGYKLDIVIAKGNEIVAVIEVNGPTHYEEDMKTLKHHTKLRQRLLSHQLNLNEGCYVNLNVCGDAPGYVNMCKIESILESLEIQRSHCSSRHINAAVKSGFYSNQQTSSSDNPHEDKQDCDISKHFPDADSGLPDITF